VSIGGIGRNRRELPRVSGDGMVFLRARRRLLRALVLTAVGMLGFALAAGPVSAHAEIVLAKPSPGSGLPQAPAAVVIKFTEPLNLALSRIEVIDTTGVDVGSGPTAPVEGDPAAMQRRLGILPAGPYTVRWTTVSTLDGHALHGSYRFGVGTSTSGDEEIRQSPLDSEGPLGLIGRFVALLGLALWVGIALLRPRLSRAEVAASTIATLGRVAPAFALAGTGLVAVSSAIVASGSIAALPGVFASGSGQLRLVVLVAAALGALVGLRSRPLALVLAGVAIVAEAASGHAATSPSPSLATTVVAVHLAAVGVWLSAILAALLSRDRLRDVLAAVSPVAITAAVALGLSGLAAAAFVLSDPGQLVSTDYGRFLIGKSLAFGTMAILGLLHNRWRRNAARPLGQIRLPLRSEGSVALFAVALAVLLVGFPNPPREAEAAEELALSDPVLARLGDTEALSVSGASGPYVLGLTILPPEPGPVEFRLQLLGLEPGDAPREARVTGSGPGTFDADLEPCGLGCFAGNGSIAGTGEWQLEVSVTTNRGVATWSTRVPIPAIDGSAQFARALDAMDGLHSARLEERLQASLDGPTFTAEYDFAAPDRMRIDAGTSERIVIGGSEYRREDGGAWQSLAWPGSPFAWPGSYYRDFWADAAAVRILGEETVDGVPSQIVGFVRPELPAWFRIWVGIDDGLVRRMEMRAEGHLMAQDWTLDVPVSIEPPGP
jgi:copper transport protein